MLFISDTDMYYIHINLHYVYTLIVLIHTHKTRHKNHILRFSPQGQVLVLWNTPILCHFQRVGRSVVQIVPGVPFPHDLLRSAKCESLPEMIRFIDVLLTRLQATKHFHSKI